MQRYIPSNPNNLSNGFESKSDILIEIIQNGDWIRVNAIDAQTGIEANIMANANTSVKILEQQATIKLKQKIKLLQKKDQSTKPKHNKHQHSQSGWDL
ncbi:MAG: hypothetical protein AAF403_07635 [Pseudomonadota bacterium]